MPKADWGLPSGEVIAFAHALMVPAGKHINTPLRLRKFQIRFVRAVYNPHDERGMRAVRQAVLSVARRNGKTLTAALIVLIHLVGPFRKPNSTIVSAATTRQQAAIVYRFVRDMVRVNPWLLKRIKIVESHKRMVRRADGSYYQAIAAEAGAQFGMGLDLVIYDELAQAKNRALYDALMTSLGSESEPLMMIISTQAPADQHVLSELIDYGERVNQGIVEDQSFVCHLYTVPRDADITDESQWKKANPGLGDFRDLSEMRQAIKRAVKLPSLESTVRVFYLNQRVRTEAPFLSQGAYETGAGAINPAIFTDGRPVYGGLDLSATTDLSALVMAAEDDNGIVHLLPFAWTPGDTLFERSQRDRAPYDAWVRQGQLIATPGPAIDYEWIALALGNLSGSMNVARIAYDRWRIKQLKEILARLGIALNLEPMGQGYQDMAPAVEAFERMCLNEQIRHGGHPVMRWCFANAVVTRSPAGDRKLDKAKAYGRIDIAQAAVMAIGAMKTFGTGHIEVAALIA